MDSEGTDTMPLNVTCAPTSVEISPWTIFLYSSREINLPLTLMVTSFAMKASKASSNSSVVLAP